jgi:hypothetical protein
MPLTTVDQGLLSTNAQYTGFKNRIINGAMMIDQRNAGAASANTISGYFLDRWQVNQSTTGKLIAQQDAGAVTPPVGFSDYLGVTSQSAYSISSTDNYNIAQFIEGFNTADLAWGTANAAPVTLSFWVRSSLTGTFGGALLNSALNRSYPFSYTISAANTWEQKSITIAGDTTGTWLTTNGVGVRIYFGIGVGSTYTGTAGAWAGSLLLAPTGATSVVGTNGATFYITGVQLEKGSTATSFDYRPYGTELQLCMRYYERWSNASETFALNTAYIYASGTLYGRHFYLVEKRAAPTVTFSASANTLLECYATALSSNLSYSGITESEIINPKSFAWKQAVSGIAAGTAVMAGIRPGQWFQFSAEL